MVQTTAATMLMRPTVRVSTNINAHKATDFVCAFRDGLRMPALIRKDLKQIMFSEMINAVKKEIQRELEKIMTSIIVNAQRTNVVLLLFPVSHGQKCEEGHFSCPSGNCISSVWLCDGQKDCEDGADEFQCGKQTNLILWKSYCTIN